MKKFILFSYLILINASFSAESPKSEPKIQYKYKQFEKFDFDEIGVEGDRGIPGDLSIVPRYQKYFKNKLPYRKNFNPEVKKFVERSL